MTLEVSVVIFLRNNFLLVKLFLHSLLFPPPLCLSHRCLWLPAWEWSWFTAGMLGCPMYAGKGALGVWESPLAITRYTGRGIGKPHGFVWIYVGQSVDSNRTMGILTIVHWSSSLPYDSCVCLYVRP